MTYIYITKTAACWYQGMRLYVFVRESVLAELGSMRVTRQP